MKKLVINSNAIAGELESGEEISYECLLKWDKVSGKLTKEDLNSMVKEFVSSYRSGCDYDICLTSALNSVGIEVEE